MSVSFPEPVEVVDHSGRISRSFEIEKMRELRSNPGPVHRKILFGEELALLRFAGGIPNHPCSSTDQRDRGVPGTLQMDERHNDKKVADVQRGCGRIKSDVGRPPLGPKRLLRALGGVLQQTAPAVLLEEIHGGQREQTCLNGSSPRSDLGTA